MIACLADRGGYCQGFRSVFLSSRLYMILCPKFIQFADMVTLVLLKGIPSQHAWGKQSAQRLM